MAIAMTVVQTMRTAFADPLWLFDAVAMVERGAERLALGTADLAKLERD